MIQSAMASHESDCSDAAVPDYTHRYHPYFTTNGLFRFVCHADDGKNLKYQCMLCFPKQRIISASRVSSSNLRTHLFRVHNFDLKALEEETKLWKRQTPKRARSSDSQFYRVIATDSVASGVPQTTLETLVTTMLADCLLPFSFAENESFKRLIHHLQPAAQLPVPSQIQINIESSFDIMKASIIAALGPVERVCITADLWSSGRRCYLGLTAHWLNGVDLNRQCAAIACRRLPGTPTCDSVSSLLNEVFREFRLEGKVAKIVTDNWEDSCCVNANASQGGVFADTPDINPDLDVTPIDLASILDIGTDKLKGDLPSHTRCMANLLNQIAQNASLTSVQGECGRMHRSVLSKAKSLWEKRGIGEAMLNVDLVEPKPGGWSSTYNALKVLTRLARDDLALLNAMCRDTQVPNFSEAEVAFITEYCRVLQPVAMALELLKSEAGCSVGYVVPTVRQLLETFGKLRNGDEAPSKPVQVCRPLVEALQQGVNEKFNAVINSEEYLTAAMLVPRFKLLWANPDEKQRLRESLKSSLRDEVPMTSHATELDSSHIHSSDFADDEQPEQAFFSFEAKRRKVSKPDPLSWYVDNYLESDCNTLMVYQGAQVLKPLFLRYNTALASAAHRTSTFHAPKTYETSDKHFEMQLMLRYNNRCSNF